MVFLDSCCDRPSLLPPMENYCCVSAVVACFLILKTRGRIWPCTCTNKLASALPWMRTFHNCLGTVSPIDQVQTSWPQTKLPGTELRNDWVKPSLWVKHCWCMPLGSPAPVLTGLPCPSKPFQCTSPSITQRLLLVVLLAACIHLKKARWESREGRWLSATFVSLNLLLIDKQMIFRSEKLNFQQQQPDLATTVFRHCLETSKASFQWAVADRCCCDEGDQCLGISGLSCLRCDTKELRQQNWKVILEIWV